MKKEEFEKINYLEQQGLKNPYRIKKLIEKAIRFNKLDFSNLVVFTEAASKNYVVTPIIAAMAGAKVYAITTDSIYGKAKDIERFTHKFAEFCDVKDKIQVIFQKKKEIISKADIITNLGFVRPINREFIFNLKKTAVIPLMYETWEFRNEDLDLKACQDKSILVLGTNEHHPKLKTLDYFGQLVLKKIFELNLELYGLKVMIIADEFFGPPIIKSLKDNNIEVIRNFNQTAEVDVLVIVYHKTPKVIIGKNGLITAKKLKQKYPFVSIIQFCGNGVIDRDALDKEGLQYIPKKAPKPGFMSWTLADLGPRPVIELHTAGLKVGEVMAKERLRGMGTEETKIMALKHSPAQDFPSSYTKR